MTTHLESPLIFERATEIIDSKYENIVRLKWTESFSENDVA